MTLGSIIDALERFSPLAWQEEYDNSGLQVGLFDETGLPLGREAGVTGVLVCLDITEAVIDEAAARGCNLVVAHHPLIFRPLKNVSGITYQQRCVAKALRLGIALYAAHTNLDNAPGGVSWEMAARLGLQDIRPLVPLAAPSASSASASAAASSVMPGSDRASLPGPACPSALPGSASAAGRPPDQVGGDASSTASDAVSSSVMPGSDRASLPGPACPSALPGSGVIGVLPDPVPAEDFVRTLATVFNAPHLRYCLPNAPASAFNQTPDQVGGDAPASASSPDSSSTSVLAAESSAPASLSGIGSENAEALIRTVALCGGSGGEYIPDAIAAGADCYVTGEIRYHDYFEAEGRMLVALGHYESEQYTVDLLCRKLQEILSQENASCGASSHSSCASPAQPSCGSSEQSLPVLKTTLDTNPLKGLL